MGAILLEDAIVWVDSGMFHQRTRAMVDRLVEQTGLVSESMILTHWHSDHIFGAQALDVPEIISSEETKRACRRALDSSWRREEILSYAEEIRKERPEYWEAAQDLEVLIPTQTFESSYRLDDAILVCRCGGHTAGSSVVIWESENTIFTGDLVFSHEFPYAGDTSCDIDRWIDVLQEIVDDAYDLIIPGHGPICNNEELLKHKAFFGSLRASVKDAISEGVSYDEYLERGKIPDFYEDTRGHRTGMAVRRAFELYG
jgi:glyoxylase-like metal-dependent hydrolase (beta-lactamase superfamily II)